ncbi:unnamed protein product [Cylicostephanus goldi]|uniref:Uncharacterized protein n=1 Tax=Cylicostephanus goldi TaxID=71465 RepID=A0A3P6U7V9_CYLGO|nr:unnamed protein product [Cylicostephanus goldi]
MWQRIRYGVRWRPSERLALAVRALDLKSVKSVIISMDPLYPGNLSLRSTLQKTFTDNERSSRTILI